MVFARAVPTQRAEQGVRSSFRTAALPEKIKKKESFTCIRSPCWICQLIVLEVKNKREDADMLSSPRAKYPSVSFRKSTIEVLRLMPTYIDKIS